MFLILYTLNILSPNFSIIPLDTPHFKSLLAVAVEISVKYGGLASLAYTSTYKITLRLFRDCNSGGATLDPTVNIGIFDKFSSNPVTGSPFSVTLDHIETIQKGGNVPCIINKSLSCFIC